MTFHKNPTHGRSSVDRPARTYQHQLCAETGYSLEDLSGAMDDWDEWRETQSEETLCSQSNFMMMT